MQRVLEPEIMSDDEQSRADAAADFSASDQMFVDLLLDRAPKDLHTILDIGCGPCGVMLRLARQRSTVRITAVDGSAAMIALASEAVRKAGLHGRIRPMQGYIPGLGLPEESFDAVLSKDLLHHLPDPMVLWREAQRLGRSGAIIQVMDLIRPETAEDARAIVARVAEDEHPVLKEDFYNSLCAAFTRDEVETQLRDAGLNFAIDQISDRHMLIRGTLP